MIDNSVNHLQQEWVTLHNNVERSEALSLLIKLLAVIVCVVGFIVNMQFVIIDLLILVLWFQEAIWKTFQSRTEQRLLVVEKAWADNDHEVALGFYSHWGDSRPGMKDLILQYLTNSIRPTVAYPYVILLVISVMLQLFEF